MSEADIIELIVDELSRSDNEHASVDQLRERARSLYTKIKLQEQDDVMPKGGGSS
jgi:hypothetical protein